MNKGLETPCEKNCPFLQRTPIKMLVKRQENLLLKTGKNGQKKPIWLCLDMIITKITNHYLKAYLTALNLFTLKP